MSYDIVKSKSTNGCAKDNFQRLLKSFVIHWLIKLGFYIPLDTKQVIETFLPANLLA